MNSIEMKSLYERGLIDGMSLVWSPTMETNKWITLARMTSSISETEPGSEDDDKNDDNKNDDKKKEEENKEEEKNKVVTPPSLDIEPEHAAWETCIDPKTNNYYEFNKTTQETRWCPTDGDWFEATGTGDVPYYIHSTTHVTQWNKPDGLFHQEEKKVSI